MEKEKRKKLNELYKKLDVLRNTVLKELRWLKKEYTKEIDKSVKIWKGETNRIIKEFENGKRR